MKKRGMTGRILYFSFFFIWLFSSSASAYIDPATTSYIIQIAAAFLITLGVVFSAFTTRVKIKLMDFRMKLLEEQLRRRARIKARGQGNQAEAMDLRREEYPVKTRIRLACLASFAAVGTFFVFGVLDLFIRNRGHFPAGIFGQIWLLFLLYGFLGAAVLAMILTLTQGKLFTALVSLLTGITLAGYLQGNFLNLNLGLLTGDAVPWENFYAHGILNGLVWLVVLAVPFVLAYFSKLLWKGFCTALPGLLIAIQTISLVASLATTQVLSEQLPVSYLAEKGMFEMSSTENTLVIVLDRLDEMYIEKALEQDPEFFSYMDGFTQYTNNLSCYVETFPSVVNMFTGKEYSYGTDYAEYMSEAYREGRLIPQLRSAGYTTKFYMAQSYTYSDIEQLRGLADNIVDGKLAMDFGKLTMKLYQLSLYRYAPHGMKAGLFMTTEAFTSLVTAQEEPRATEEEEDPLTPAGENVVFFHQGGEGEGSTFVTDEASFQAELEKQFIYPKGQYVHYGIQTESQPYLTDDVRFYDLLDAYGLSIQQEKNNFTYYHLAGAHEPYIWDEFGEQTGPGGSSDVQQTMGSFIKLYGLLDQMKMDGLYENANIIVMGDHGKRALSNELGGPVLTGLFVKRKGETGPLRQSHAPVNVDNFRASVAEMAGIETEEYGPAYWEVPEDSPVVRRFQYVCLPYDGTPPHVQIYDVYGDAQVFENWKMVDDRFFEN